MAAVHQPIVAGVWSTDSVRDVAEQLGIATLGDDVLTAAAADVEYRIHEIVEEAAKFMRHAKRTKLKVEDVEYAMKARNMEPIWGFSAPNTLAFRKTQTPTGTLYFYDDEEIDLTRIYKTQLPPAPRDVSYTAHWLAVEGIQPAIPQNPSAAELQALTQPHASTSAAATAGQVDVRPLVKHVLSRELQQYFDRLTQAAEDSDGVMRQAALKCLQADTGLGDLVPYLVQWVSERVVANLSVDLANLETLLDLVRAMLDNPTLFVEPYVHQLIPSILSILLTADLAPSTDFLPATYLRDYAASLLGRILSTYSGAYISLQPRVLKTLLTALSGKGDLYGALKGLAALSREAVLSTLGKPLNLRAVDAALATEDDPERRTKLVDLVITALQTAFAAAPPSTADIETLSPTDAASHYGVTLADAIARHPPLAEHLLALENGDENLVDGADGDAAPQQGSTPTLADDDETPEGMDEA